MHALGTGRMRPIRVFYSTLTGRFYATRTWREKTSKKGAPYIEVVGDKFDVTDDIAGAIIKHDIAFKMQDQ